MISGYLYPPTFLHRVPAGLKLLTLVVLASLLVVVEQWWVFACGIVLALALYAILGSQAVKRLSALKTLMPLLVIIYALQWYVSGHVQAGVSVGRLILMIMIADLVTMTTPMQAMLDTMAPLFRPLERFGLSSARIALAIALVIRFLPVLFDLWSKRREAWQARTSRRMPPRLIMLFLVDTLQMADHVAEALDARGYENTPNQGKQHTS